jgi:chorismate mutase
MSERRLRALRGATTVERDEEDLVLEATRVLLETLMRENHLGHRHLVSAFFTATPDLVSVFPSQAVRELGWHELPLLCAAEINVRGALPRCVRVMLHAELPAEALPRHVYLGAAQALRPDRAYE